MQRTEERRQGMNITIGSDHGATLLKDEVKMVLAEYGGIRVSDVGTFGTDPVDYPDIAEKVCADITGGKAELGIVLCGTGIGISMAANKIKGIRCALCHDVYSAKKAREHNDANVLAMGGRVLGFGSAEEIIRAFLGAKFEGGRHERRIKKIMQLEAKD